MPTKHSTLCFSAGLANCLESERTCFRTGSHSNRPWNKNFGARSLFGRWSQKTQLRRGKKDREERNNTVYVLKSKSVLWTAGSLENRIEHTSEWCILKANGVFIPFLSEEYPSVLFIIHEWVCWGHWCLNTSYLSCVGVCKLLASSWVVKGAHIRKLPACADPLRKSGRGTNRL